MPTPFLVLVALGLDAFGQLFVGIGYRNLGGCCCEGVIEFVDDDEDGFTLSRSGTDEASILACCVLADGQDGGGAGGLVVHGVGSVGWVVTRCVYIKELPPTRQHFSVIIFHNFQEFGVTITPQSEIEYA